jgi:hypothetical protein
MGRKKKGAVGLGNGTKMAQQGWKFASLYKEPLFQVRRLFFTFINTTHAINVMYVLDVLYIYIKIYILSSAG